MSTVSATILAETYAALVEAEAMAKELLDACDVLDRQACDKAREKWVRLLRARTSYKHHILTSLRPVEVEEKA